MLHETWIQFKMMEINYMRCRTNGRKPIKEWRSCSPVFYHDNHAHSLSQAVSSSRDQLVLFLISHTLSWLESSRNECMGPDDHHGMAISFVLTQLSNHSCHASKEVGKSRNGFKGFKGSKIHTHFSYEEKTWLTGTWVKFNFYLNQ